jgi:hypothetical protein
MTIRQKADRWYGKQTMEPGTYKNWANSQKIVAMTLELPPSPGPDLDDLPDDNDDFELAPNLILSIGEEAYVGILEFLDVQKHGDPDEDGVYDLRDNCIEEPNYLQRDCDGNGVGDACDSNNTCERHMMMVVDESTSMEESDDFTEVMRYQHVYAGGTATIIENYL